MKCKNCDSTKELKDIHQKGYMSCCPEREMKLTDEEIESIFQKETGFTFDCDAKVDEVAMLDFARAILRKAQEK